MASLIGISLAQYATWETSQSVPYKYVDKLSDILDKDFSTVNIFTPELLKTTRRLADLTQQDVAAYLGITQQSYVRWEQETKSGFDKYEEKLLGLFKKHLKGKPVVPMYRKKVSGAVIMFYLDECYILVHNNRAFNRDRYVFNKNMNISQYIKSVSS